MNIICHLAFGIGYWVSKPKSIHKWSKIPMCWLYISFLIIIFFSFEVKEGPWALGLTIHRSTISTICHVLKPIFLFPCGNYAFNRSINWSPKRTSEWNETKGVRAKWMSERKESIIYLFINIQRGRKLLVSIIKTFIDSRQVSI